MGIRTYCPNGHKLNIKTFQAGQRGICPICGARFDIPRESTRKSSKEPDTARDPDVGGGTAPGGTSGGTASQPSPARTGGVEASPVSTAQQPAHAAGPNPFAGGETPLPGLPVGSPSRQLPSIAPPSGGGRQAESAATDYEYELTLETEGPAENLGPPDAATPGAPSAPTTTAPSVPASAAPQQGPSPSDPLAEAPLAVWYVRPSSGGQYGPAAADVMRTWIGEGRVSPDSLVWREGWRDWRQAGEVFPHLNPTSQFPDFGAGTGTVARSASAAEGLYRSASQSRVNNTTILITLLVVVVVSLIAVFIWVLARDTEEARGGPATQTRAVASKLVDTHAPAADELGRC